MHTKIRFRVRLSVCRDFREPRTRHHDRRRSDELLIECREASYVFRMRYRQIIGIEDQQLGIKWIPQADLQRLPGAGRKNRGVICGDFPFTTGLHKRQCVAQLERFRCVGVPSSGMACDHGGLCIFVESFLVRAQLRVVQLPTANFLH